MNNKIQLGSLFLLGMLTGCGILGSTPTAMPVQGGYAILVSKETLKNAEWSQVVENLKAKYQGQTAVSVLTWNDSPWEIRADLAELAPRYSCFVAESREIDTPFTIAINQICRALDDDPYTDTFWGILTGYDASDPMRNISHKKLKINDAIDSLGVLNLNWFNNGWRFDDANQQQIWVKNAGNVVDLKKCEQDYAVEFIEAFDKISPQLYVCGGTMSSHNRWKMSHAFPNIAITEHNGILKITDQERRQYQLINHEPKVMIAPQCSKLGSVGTAQHALINAWIHSFGVQQFAGYVTSAWYSQMGPTIVSLLCENPGEYNFTESFHFANIEIMRQFIRDYPEKKSLPLFVYDDTILKALGYYHQLYVQSKNGIMRDDLRPLGLKFDLDGMVLYGDPGMDAQVKSSANVPFHTVVQKNRENSETTVSINTTIMGKWPVTGIYARLPIRYQNPQIKTHNFPVSPELNDDFVYFPLKGNFKAQESYKLVIEENASSVDSEKNKDVVISDAEKIRQLLQLCDESIQPALKRALSQSLNNLGELEKALRKSKNAMERKCIIHLLINSCERDLQQITAELLLDNTKYALEAYQKCPWKEQLSEQLFLDYILPFACFDEKRDNWRKDFYHRFSQRAFDCKSPSEALQLLNKIVFKELEVEYHATKRRIPNQSPYESMALHYASCTGLSIILADAARACGIPVRIVGCPLWTDRSGNHNWIEFWDNQWIYEGASNSDPRNRDWVGDKVKKFTDASKWEHSVLAATYRRRPSQNHFIFVWQPFDPMVPAIPITAFYTDDHTEEINVEKNQIVWIFFQDEPLYRLTEPGENKAFLPKGLNFMIHTTDLKGNLLLKKELKISQ